MSENQEQTRSSLSQLRYYSGSWVITYIQKSDPSFVLWTKCVFNVSVRSITEVAHASVNIFNMICNMMKPWLQWNKIISKYFKIISVFYFTCNRAWNWNKIKQ